MMTPYRSKLFVPGNRSNLFEKAITSGADAISIDLEDAVPDAERPDARRAVRQFLETRTGQVTGGGPDIVVRVNSRQSGQMIEDLMAVVRPGLDVVNLPKVNDPDDIVACADVINDLAQQRNCANPVKIMATLESPAGVRRAAEIAKAHTLVAGLQFGAGDYSISMGMQGSPQRFMPTWMTLIGAAREAGIAVYDSAFSDIDDLSGFEAWAQEAKACGFDGKSCIHPSQVKTCNRVFSPSAQEIKEAREIVEAYDQAVASGRGALTFKGQLVDYPIAENARRVAGIPVPDDQEIGEQ